MSSASSPRVLSETKGKGVCWVTINRPKLGNAIDPATFHDIIAALKAAAADKNVRVVVVTGAGKFFTTGADVLAVVGDVKSQQNANPETIVSTLKNSSIALTQLLIDFPKPIVAAVNGPAVGWPAGALGLFDLVLCSETATLSTPFSKLGLSSEGLSSVTFPQIMGTSMATEVLLFGRVLKANEMVSCGLATRVLPVENFCAEVHNIVEGFVKTCSAASLMASKKLARDPMRDLLTKQNDAEFRSLVKRFKSGEPYVRFEAVGRALAAKKSKL